MKPLHFSLNIPQDQSIFVKEELLETFYPHFHKHDAYQLVWIVCGKGKLLVDNSMHDFESDDIFLIGSNQPHVFKSEDPTVAIHTVSVFFDFRGALDYIFTLPELRGLKSFIKEQSQGFKVPMTFLEEVKGYIEQLQQAEGVDRFIQFIYLLKCLNIISTDSLPLAGTSLKRLNNDTSIKIVSICKYMQDNFRKDIRLGQLAEIANLTPQAFCRFFKKSTGKTFVTYLNELRVEESCRLLVNDRYVGISIIAFDAGFKSITNFNRVFRSLRGVSPKEFINLYQESLSK